MKALRLGVALAVGVGSVGALGCSSLGGLGGGQPAYKLTDSAKAVRSAFPSSQPIPKETQKALHPPYVVEAGDTLLVQPADLDSPIRLPGDQPVLADGTIDLGRYGRPVVSGKTLPQIESEVTEVIRASIKADAERAKAEAARTMTEADRAKAAKDAATAREIPSAPVVVTVRLVGRASKVYYVIGEVNAPGAFPVSGRETVLDAIFAAGNLTRKASTRNIILSRPTSPDGCRTVLPICWDDITQLADPSTNYQIMPGDRIYVASKNPLEDFHARRKGECPPCNRPQVPCAGGTCAAPAAGPVVTPDAAPVVVLPTVGNK